MKGQKNLFAFALAVLLAVSAVGCSGGNHAEDPSNAGNETIVSQNKEESKITASVDSLEPADAGNEQEKPAETAQAPEELPKASEPDTVGAAGQPETKKETAYKSGITRVLADDGYYFYELEFLDGELVTGQLDSEEGKGGWGGDSGYGIENCEFYGMTVEEAAESLESQNYTVTIQ